MAGQGSSQLREGSPTIVKKLTAFRDQARVAAQRVGRETVQYVSNIYKYYVAYRLAYEEIQARRAAAKP